MSSIALTLLIVNLFLGRRGPRILDMHRLPILAFAAASFACGDPTGPSDEIPGVPDVAPYVTGAAADAVDSDGRFILTRPAELALQPIIEPATATRLAVGYIRTFISGPTITLPGTHGLRAGLEDRHGHAVAWTDVRAVPGGPYFAESFVPPLPAELPGWVRRDMGPHYLVPLHVDGDHVATIRVSALAHEVYVDDDGYVIEPVVSGGVWGQGAPHHDWGHSLPPSPERAAVFAATSTGARIAEVPRLVKPGHRITSLAAYWMLVLERTVTLTRLVDDGARATDTVYVRVFPEEASRGKDLRLFVTAEEQPDSFRVRYEDEDGVDREYLAARRHGFAVNFHEALPQ